MSRRLIVLALIGCSGDPPASTPDALLPDGGGCSGTNAICDGDVLQICIAEGETPVLETCNWGCETSGCKRLTPTGGGVPRLDVVPTQLNAFAEVSVSGTLDGATGKINGTDASTMDIGYSLINGIGVFRFKRLAIGALKLVGTSAVQLVADGPITVEGALDATGSCGIGAPEIAGAGGGNGGQTSAAPGALIGGGGTGGGGGWGGTGGGALGGIATDDPTVLVLRGGAGGGAGTGSTTFQGGGGGGAIQLISNTSITIAGAGSINAGGCGGRKGTAADDEGGGGGAGGTIVLEAPIVTLATGRVIAVNGGGGGGGGAGATDGGAGQLSRNPALGGNAGTNGGAGGAGGAVLVDGAAGTAAQLAGGGGGGSGRIRINTRSGTAVIDGVMSPAFDDPGTTATQGTASLP